MCANILSYMYFPCEHTQYHAYSLIFRLETCRPVTPNVSCSLHLPKEPCAWATDPQNSDQTVLRNQAQHPESHICHLISPESPMVTEHFRELLPLRNSILDSERNRKGVEQGGSEPVIQLACNSSGALIMHSSQLEAE